MRYAGGGVGHYKIELNDAHNSGSESTENIAADEEELLVDLPQAMPQVGQDNTASDNSSNSDSSSGGSEDDEGVDEDNLPEDGEGGFIDAEDEEGYAVL